MVQGGVRRGRGRGNRRRMGDLGATATWTCCDSANWRVADRGWGISGGRAVSKFFSATSATDSLSMRYLSGSDSSGGSGRVRIPIGSAVYQN